MKPNKEQIIDLLNSRATNYKDYNGNQKSYVPDDDYEYIADKILTLVQSNSDSQPNGSKPVVSGALPFRCYFFETGKRVNLCEGQCEGCKNMPDSFGNDR